MFKNQIEVLVTFGLLITGRKKHFDSISASAAKKTEKNSSLIQQKKMVVFINTFIRFEFIKLVSIVYSFRIPYYY